MLQKILFFFLTTITAVCIFGCQKKIPIYPYKNGTFFFYYEPDPAHVLPYDKKPIKELSQNELQKMVENNSIYYGITFDDKGHIIEMVSYKKNVWQTKKKYKIKSDIIEIEPQEQNPAVFNKDSDELN